MFVSGLQLACAFDMCALEGSATQDAFRCSIYTVLVSFCYDFANTKGLNFNLTGWRNATNCRKLNLRNSMY